MDLEQASSPEQDTEIQAMDAAAKANLVKLGAQTNADLTAYIPADLLERYEFYSFRHAAEILATSCRAEFGELLDALRDRKSVV